MTLPAAPAGVSRRIAELDAAVDRWFDRNLRDRRAADSVFYTASALGDHSVLWLTLAALQALRRRGGEWKPAFVRAVVGLAGESIFVNGPVKWMFRRSRPLQEVPRPMYLRQPRTSSFPSGHATAAFFAAAVLRDDDPSFPLYYALAAVVATSRIHVRIHHASDVIGGVVIGAVLGELAREVSPLGGTAESRGPRRGWHQHERQVRRQLGLQVPVRP
jgi:undecaprenyl-diphosphatase